jgi:hypothetical protein
MTSSKLFLGALFLSLAGSCLYAAGDKADALPVERYAIYVASDDGGPGLERLRYARSDARRLASTMGEIGGVSARNTIMLVDPSKDDIQNAFDSLTDTIRKNAGRARRTEFLFYYSGHSDEKALRLGNETYEYGKLKSDLGRVPSDVHVVMLDSCFSGNFVRAKGGSRQKPFLMDDSTIVQGHAYLSSSSEREESQESDAIQASYFTQALVTGLRGAADTSGDGKVSLNELYHYAFNETLAKTESSTVGPQHPSYNITLVGSGDLVLTDISEAESVLVIPSAMEGSFFIRTPDGILVSEINKIKGTEIALALPANTYTVAIVTATTTSQTIIPLAKGQRLALDGRSFNIIPRTFARSRGPDQEELTVPETDETHTPVSVSFCPGVSIPSPMADRVNVALGVFMADNKHIEGVQASSFMGTMSGDLRGVQAAGFMNTISGKVNGVQVAGFMNSATDEGPFKGVQAAGFLNNISGSLEGVQAGYFLNETKHDIKGAQLAGFLNDAKGNGTGFQGAGFLNNIGGDFTGAQAAGFLNVAHGQMTGAQIAGFLNVANEISGAQIGVINVAKSNSGVAIGFLNFIKDGIMTASLSLDSNENWYWQYQGGTNKFFTTLMFGGGLVPGNRGYLISGFGCGTRFRTIGKLSFDAEILYKHIINTAWLKAIQDRNGGEIAYDGDDGVDTPEEQELRAWGRESEHCGMPAARVTANYKFFKHLSAFASVNLDLMVKGYNEQAFEFGHTAEPISLSSDGSVKAYPSCSIGVGF